MKYKYLYDPEYERGYDFSDRHWTQPRKHFRKYNRKQEEQWHRRATHLREKRMKRIENLYA
jgi:hypothetical protein